jgi:hypothetical protein
MNRILLTVFVLVVVALLPGCPSFLGTGSAAFSDPEVLVCGLTKCTIPMFLCVLDPDCREALECNAACSAAGGQAEQQACNLVCQLTQGGSSERYAALVQCFAENGCLPTLPPGTDGRGSRGLELPGPPSADRPPSGYTAPRGPAPEQPDRR